MRGFEGFLFDVLLPALFIAMSEGWMSIFFNEKRSKKRRTV
jgi:hypothetical protein